MQQTKGTIDAIVEEIRLAEYGVHYLVIYPDMITLRRIYSYYAKMQLEDNNEIVSSHIMKLLRWLEMNCQERINIIKEVPLM